ncbi:hypothetical protein [Actinoallomurus soli]|uniref:hypothetical protein n=1 Tax=Actinoallomurus soli TaxID=2952535 RepID=UPI0020931CB3|nr:hypothetical protein [Actinoallomurus soli]MCO5971374.1 hypothetical protein [Actinoallomurus soli]
MNTRQSHPDGPAEAVDQWAFAEVVEDGPRGRGSAPRVGPALAAAAAAAVVVVGAAVVPALKKGPLGPPAAGSTGGVRTGANVSAPAAPGGGQAQPPAAGTQGGATPGRVPLTGQGASSASLTYANHVIVGPGASCCWTPGGTWSAGGRGGYPAYGGSVRTSADPSAWFEWNLGNPAGGSRWDQVKIRVWIPQTQAGAWVRITVTSTAGGASNVTSFDVAEQEYQGWYELPATFTLGTPDRRTGSAWVRMTYLRPYTDPAADSACADGSCDRMAAAQAEFLWS